jgi:predicted 3-demethylubiquinone-9 3-methyltransferase (glyoxalase superfamily)
VPVERCSPLDTTGHTPPAFVTAAQGHAAHSLGSWPTRISANYSNVLWLVDKFCVPWQTVPHVSVRAMSARWARLRITVHVAQR